MNFLKNKLWIFFLIGICKCNTEGHRGSSDSIEDSKRRGTFIGQYRVDFVQDTIGKIINNNVDEVFVEYSWFVKPPQSIIDTTCINIVIRTSDSNAPLLTNAYQIKLYSGSNFTQHSKNTLWVFSPVENSFDKQSVTDSIAFKIYKGEKYLGEAMFVREN